MKDWRNWEYKEWIEAIPMNVPQAKLSEDWVEPELVEYRLEYHWYFYKPKTS